MHWKNKKFTGWRKKFAWTPNQILDNGVLKEVWLSWYERKWTKNGFEERLCKMSYTADISTFSTEWRYPLALFPVRVEGGYTVWLSRYAKRYTGRSNGEPGYPSGDSDYWTWEKLRYIDYVERIMTNGSDNGASKR